MKDCQSTKFELFADRLFEHLLEYLGVKSIIKNHLSSPICLLQKADMAASPMFITRIRSKAVDFTSPFMEVTASLLTRRPSDSATVLVKSAHDLLNNPSVTYVCSIEACSRLHFAGHLSTILSTPPCGKEWSCLDLRQ